MNAQVLPRAGWETGILTNRVWIPRIVDLPNRVGIQRFWTKGIDTDYRANGLNMS